MNSERSHHEKVQKDEAYVEVTGQGQNKIQFKKINMQAKHLQERAKEDQSSHRGVENCSELELGPSVAPPPEVLSHNLLPPKGSNDFDIENPYSKQNQLSPSEFKNNKNIGKDLEVIKENHSEFSNSNSAIETFRKKKKSNISSSGNNSGDQNLLHNGQEMINEEDEEDMENDNDTTSFRGPKNLNPYGNIIPECREEQKQSEALSNFKKLPSQNSRENNLKVYIE